MAGQYTGNGEAHDVYEIGSLGSGSKITATDTVELTHEAAREHLDLPAFAGERPVRQNHVAALISHMERGTFHPEWVQLMVCRCKEPMPDIAGDERKAGTVWRVNGQHTCWARLDMPADFRCPVKRITYSAATAYDLRLLYASADRSAPRTKKHVVTSYLAGLNGFEHHLEKSLSLAPSGLMFWQESNEGKHTDGDSVAYLMQTEFYDVTQKVLDFLDTLQQVTHRFLMRSGAVGAMYATFSKAPQIAADFWKAVGSGIGFDDATDPRLKLRNMLMTTAVNFGGGARKSLQKKCSPEEMYRVCLQCWNAFREGRSLQVLKSGDKRPAVK